MPLFFVAFDVVVFFFGAFDVVDFFLSISTPSFFVDFDLVAFCFQRRRKNDDDEYDDKTTMSKPTKNDDVEVTLLRYEVPTRRFSNTVFQALQDSNGLPQEQWLHFGAGITLPQVPTP